MPLQPDGRLKGMTSVHVHGHPKLVYHRTIIKEALSIVSDMADDDRVAAIDLGKVSVRHSGLRQRCDFSTDDVFVAFVFVGQTAAQSINIELLPMPEAQITAFTLEIKQRWERQLAEQAN